MDVWSHEERISQSSTNDKEDHREKVVRTCYEKGRRARTKENIRCTNTRKEMERKTENQVDRLVYKKRWKCGVKGEGRTGQDKVKE